MGILEKIKSFFLLEEKAVSQSEQKARIEFKDIGRKLEEISKDLFEREKNVEEEISKKAQETSEKLKEQLLILKSITLEERKESEKLKFIVMENLAFYISNLEKFSADIIKKQKIEEIKTRLMGFDKNTKANFEKASILIGKELEETKNNIKEFVINFNLVIENNKEIFEKKKKIGGIKNLLLKIEEYEKQEKEANSEIEEKEKEKGRIGKEKETKEKETNEMKNNEKYKEIEKKKQEIERENEETKERARKTKEKIDFKELKRNHHTNSKNMDVIKNYENNFLLSLEEDKNMEFMSIVNNEEIGKEIKWIREKLIEIKSAGEEKLILEIKEKEDEAKKLNESIAGIRSFVDDCLEKIEKLGGKKEEIKKEVREKLESLNVSLL